LKIPRPIKERYSTYLIASDTEKKRRIANLLRDLTPDSIAKQSVMPYDEQRFSFIREILLSKGTD
jgi:hypothetical protein